MLERIGKYEIRLQLGRGGMGVVYEGFDPSIERRVAIKTLRTEFIEDDQLAEFLERFRREAKSAGRLSHPHIVTIYEYGEENDMPYIVMEYVSGRDLSVDLKRGVRYALPDVVRIMTQLLSALAHAHEHGVVHRDIKPANILLLDDGSLKVVDFGIARIEEAESFTKSGVVIGTPSYMAPEQILGLPASARSDVFSCGVLLYQLLTGDRPFTGDEFSIKQKVLRMDPMPPSSLNPTLGPPWDAVVSRAMTKKPEARYDTARQFLEAIRSAQEAESQAGEVARRKAMEAEEHARREAEERSRATAARRAEDERLAEIEQAREKAAAEEREKLRRKEAQRVEAARVSQTEAGGEARGMREVAERDRVAALVKPTAPRASPASQTAPARGARSSRAIAITISIVAVGLAFAFWFWQRGGDEVAKTEAARSTAEAGRKAESEKRLLAQEASREETARRATSEVERNRKESEERATLEAELARKSAEAKRKMELSNARIETERTLALASKKKEDEEKRAAEIAAKKELEARATAEAVAAAASKANAALKDKEEKAKIEAARKESEEKAKADEARRSVEEKARVDNAARAAREAAGPDGRWAGMLSCGPLYASVAGGSRDGFSVTARMTVQDGVAVLTRSNAIVLEELKGSAKSGLLVLGGGGHYRNQPARAWLYDFKGVVGRAEIKAKGEMWAPDGIT